MKKLLLISLIIFVASSAFAQRPKMHLKARLGFHVHAFVEKNDDITSEFFAGFHGGFGFRVMYKKLFGEVDFDFLRSYFYVEIEPFDEVELQLNTFELPISVGYITVKKPIFKHFLYGGIVTHFNVKSFARYTVQNQTETVYLRPNELFLVNPQFLMRFGTQFDVAMFNFDFSYNIGLNNAFKSNVRTQVHHVQLTIGFVF